MNGSRRLLFLLIVAVVSNHSLKREFLLLALEGQTISVCEEKSQSSNWSSISGFVEEATEYPKKIYVTEPIRVSFKSSLSFEYLQTIEGKWINIHYINDESICFHLNHEQTEKMSKKSDDLQQRLQQRMKGKRD